MRRRLVGPGIVVVACLAAGALVGLLTQPRRLADASTYVLMADSLWQDHDLRYGAEDLRRVDRLKVDDLPAGLFLTKRDGEYFYGKPFVYPLAAAPFLRLFGIRGFYVLNGMLLAAIVLLGADLVSPGLRWSRRVAVSALVIGFSVAPAYLRWIDPFLFYTTVVAAGLVAHRRGRPALSGALLAAVGYGRGPYLGLLAAPVIVCASDGRWRDLRRLACVLAMVAGVLLLVTRVATGQWSPYLGERYWFPAVPPYATGHLDGIGIPYSKGHLLTDWRVPSLADVAVNARNFLVGRYSGLILYFPTFFACALWAVRIDKEKIAWLSAVAVVCLLLQLLIPHNPIGGTHALGNRLFVLLPVALLLVDVVGWIPWRLAPTVLLLLLVVPVMGRATYFSLYPGRQMLEIPYRWFPLEWNQARAMIFPYSFPGLMALTPNQFDWDPSGGVWTVRGTRAEFVLIRPLGEPVTVGLSSVVRAIRVSDGPVSRDVYVPAGVTETVTLAHPRAVIADESDGRDRWAVYHLTVETRADGAGSEPRDLGVFVRPLQFQGSVVRVAQ